MPPNKSLILEGPEGSLAKFGIKDLTFTHTPGHCKGHIVYHHKPSGYMLAGDFADVLKDNDGGYSFKTMCARTCNMTDAHDTICRCAADTLSLLAAVHDPAARKAPASPAWVSGMRSALEICESLCCTHVHAACQHPGAGRGAPMRRWCCRIVHKMDYKLLLPYHDARKSGWSKAELIPLAEEYSNCTGSKPAAEQVSE